MISDAIREKKFDAPKKKKLQIGSQLANCLHF